MQIKTTLRCHLTSTKKAKIRKIDNTEHWWACKTLEHSYITDSSANWFKCLAYSLAPTSKVEGMYTLEPSDPSS